MYRADLLFKLLVCLSRALVESRQVRVRMRAVRTAPTYRGDTTAEIVNRESVVALRPRRLVVLDTKKCIGANASCIPLELPFRLVGRIARGAVYDPVADLKQLPSRQPIRLGDHHLVG